jgi:hypothetical protein
MTFLWPGIRKQNQDFVQGLRCNLPIQNFNGIVAEDSDIGQASLFQVQQQTADARAVNLDSQVVALGMRLGQIGQVIAVAEADLQGEGCPPAEHGSRIQRYGLKGQSEPGPEGIERSLLGFGNPAAPHHEGADGAGVFNIRQVTSGGPCGDQS